ncbi:uncharacterized protein LOC132821131 [Hemiscyllium ocellatum]|uniref:uncharacterized protein LOC132821131 n=1 Tax=Hemiscyllium ocellatum TaxID=170820 RepID=UPI0029677882|nr:uncharacterized protein LOC132821131 [Hemiscyllium ocellatum]
MCRQTPPPSFPAQITPLKKDLAQGSLAHAITQGVSHSGYSSSQHPTETGSHSETPRPHYPTETGSHSETPRPHYPTERVSHSETPRPYNPTERVSHSGILHPHNPTERVSHSGILHSHHPIERVSHSGILHPHYPTGRVSHSGILHPHHPTERVYHSGILHPHNPIERVSRSGILHPHNPTQRVSHSGILHPHNPTERVSRSGILHPHNPTERVSHSGILHPHNPIERVSRSGILHPHNPTERVSRSGILHPHNPTLRVSRSGILHPHNPTRRVSHSGILHPHNPTGRVSCSGILHPHNPTESVSHSGIPSSHYSTERLFCSGIPRSHHPTERVSCSGLHQPMRCCHHRPTAHSRGSHSPCFTDRLTDRLCSHAACENTITTAPEPMEAASCRRALSTSCDKRKSELGTLGALLTKRIHELKEIANSIDQHHKGTKIANIIGSLLNAAGGIIYLAGLIAAPFTLGMSSVLIAVGQSIGGVGAVISLITGNVGYATQKKAEEIIQECDRKTTEYLEEFCPAYQCSSPPSGDEDNEVSSFFQKLPVRVQKWIQTLKKLGNLIEKLKKWRNEIRSIVQTACILNKIRSVIVSSKQAIKTFANELAEQIAGPITVIAQNMKKEVRNVVRKVGQTPGAWQSLSGILTAVFVGADVYSVISNSIEFSKGTNSEIAKKIRKEAERIEVKYESVREYVTRP